MATSSISRRRWGAALLAALGLAAAGPACAWDNQGHMAIGAIAYDALMREHPELVPRIVALMAQHPDRARFERELAGVPATGRDRILFEYMARWPDDVGGTPADHVKWHYAEKPANAWGWAFPLTFGQAELALEAQAALAADPRAPAAKRAVALCWVFHIVGDMQQPLHAGTWVSPRFPLSDLGGTRAYVRRTAGAAPVNLHDFWDGAASLPEPEVQGAQALARRVELAYPPWRPASARVRRARRLPIGAAFRTWAAEDRWLARDAVYRAGAFQGATTAAEAQAVPAPYAAQARALAEVRIALGGDRLAALLQREMRPARR